MRQNYHDKPTPRAVFAVFRLPIPSPGRPRSHRPPINDSFSSPPRLEPVALSVTAPIVLAMQRTPVDDRQRLGLRSAYPAGMLLVTAKDAAGILGVAVTTVYDLVQRGQLIRQADPWVLRAYDHAEVEALSLHLVENVRLVASELATNAVSHAQTTFVVTLSLAGGSVLLALQGESLSVPVQSTPGLMDMGGRGLMIVKLLSQEWGTSTDDRGFKSVWASFPEAASASGRSSG